MTVGESICLVEANPMTTRERMLAVVRGEEHDRVPFVQYDNNGAPNEDAWALLGRDNMGILRWQSIHWWEHPNCRIESEEVYFDGRRGVRHTMHTPAGSLNEERIYQPTYGVEGYRTHFVKEPKDYAVLLAYLRDAVLHDNLDVIDQYNAELGDDGFCHVSVERTPYQQLWIEWVSLLDLGLHLVDCPDTIEEVTSVLAENERKIFQLVPRARIPYIVIPDNLTAPAIGEKYFRQYCLPLYQELVGICNEVGLPVYAHLDGDLKPVWKAIGESGIRGIDSFSPPPDNDTSPAQAAAMWPEMRLCVNYPSSVHLREPEAIYRRTMEILNEAGHTGRLQIQISENVPPGLWRTSYPQIVRAIRDFGKP